MSNRETRASVHHKKKKRRLRKWVTMVLILCLVAFIAVFSYGTYVYVKANSVLSDSFVDTGREQSDLREQPVDPTEDNISVLFIGTDNSEQNPERGGGNPRSDALVLATLNKNENSVKLLSIPRDSLVYIPYLGYETKINHAYSRGGPPATVETVENLLDIPVDYFVSLNFDAFVETIDALGGINYEVPFELLEQNSKGEQNAIHLEPGFHELNGEEALALARTRKYDSDIERGQRQLEIIQATARKALSPGTVFKLGDIIEAIGSNMTTNMTFGEMRGLFSYATNSEKLDVETLTLQGENYQPGGTYYYRLDDTSIANTRIALKEHLEIE